MGEEGRKKRENLATMVSGETCHKLRKWRKFFSSVWLARQFLLLTVKKFGNRSVWALLSHFSLALIKVKLYAIIVQASASTKVGVGART